MEFKIGDPVVEKENAWTKNGHERRRGYCRDIQRALGGDNDRFLLEFIGIGSCKEWLKCSDYEKDFKNEGLGIVEFCQKHGFSFADMSNGIQIERQVWNRLFDLAGEPGSNPKQIEIIEDFYSVKNYKFEEKNNVFIKTVYQILKNAQILKNESILTDLRM